MYYKLKKNIWLRGWEKLPYAIVNTDNGKALFVNSVTMDALNLCNGKIDTDLPFIPQKYREIIKILEKDSIVEKCKCGEEIEKRQEYRLCPARYIKTAHWSITGKCNYKCKHCYMSAPDAKMGELSHTQIFSIIDQLEECGIMNVTLTGGEPLVRSDFLEIVDALIERKIRIETVYSNGFLVTDKLLCELDKRGIHPEFNMSFDGVGHHDWLRGIKGAEQYAKDAFLRCKKWGFPTGAEMCIFKENKNTLRETVNLLASLGCRSLKTNPVSNVGEWAKNGYGESIDLKELYSLYLDYIPKYYEDGMPLTLQLGGFFFANNKTPYKFAVASDKNCKNPDTTCICNHARNVMYIAPDGRVLPCMSLSGMEIQKEFPMITELGLAKCISDSRYMEMIDTRVSDYFKVNPKCKECKYALNCIGGCRASALETSCDIMAPDLSACEIFCGGWYEKIIEAGNKGVELMKFKQSTNLIKSLN